MSLKKLLLIFFALNLLARSLLALNPESRLSQYGHTAWRVQDGSLNGYPTALAQTPDGYIWVGTKSGLYRFDGVGFLAWYPPSGQRIPFRIDGVSVLHTASDGSLWIGALGGLARLANDRFTSLDAPSARVLGIAEDGEGAIWIARDHMQAFTGPICKVSAEMEQCFGKSDGIQTFAAGSIAVDARGRVWASGLGTLIEREGKHFREYFLPGAKAPDVTRIVESTVVDAQGIVWTGEDRTGPRDGLRRFSNGRWESFIVPGFNGANVSVNTLFFDRDHCLWIGTTNQGIYRVHGQSVEHFGRADGLSSNSINQIFQDREGGIWVATGEGLDHFRDLGIVTYSSIEGFKTDYVSAILARPDGSVTVSGISSIAAIQGSVVTPERMPRWIRQHPSTMLVDHRGNLWVGADGGLRVEVDGRWKVILESNLTDSIPSLAEDDEHAIWAVVAGPHARLLHIENFRVRQQFQPPEIPGVYSVIADPHGGVFASLYDGDLMQYRNGEWQKLHIQPLIRGNSRVGGIFNMSFDFDGILWGAATSGVVAYRNGNLRLLNERNGLPCAVTYATISDLHGNLWVLAQCGLLRIQKSELDRWWSSPDSRLKILTFTTTDGFSPGAPVGHPAVVRGTDGKLWFHNSSVVMMIDPEHLVENTVVPPVHMEQLIADRRPYETRNDLQLPAKTHQLEIDYAGLSFVAPSKVLFRYMLEGYDTQWQEPGIRRAAFYNDLRPGKYTFRVIASNNSGLWNTEGALLQFSILPAYYQTVWFRVLSGAAFAALLWGLYQLRLRQLQQQFDIGLEARVKERTRIARELHDTLLQSLHGLMFKFQAARNMLPRRPEDAIQTLDKAIFETEQAIVESRDAIHDLRSQLVSHEDLAPLLEAAGEELGGLQDASQTLPSFRVIAEGEPQKLSPDLQDEVYRIAREVLRNAFQHSGAGQVEIEIRYDKNQLRVRIRDDGKGIDPEVLEESRRPGHWGLPGVRERAERIGSQLKFWSQAGAGTEVELTIPGAIAYEDTRNGRRLKLPRKERKL